MLPKSLDLTWLEIAFPDSCMHYLFFSEFLSHFVTVAFLQLRLAQPLLGHLIEININ